MRVRDQCSEGEGAGERSVSRGVGESVDIVVITRTFARGREGHGEGGENRGETNSVDLRAPLLGAIGGEGEGNR